MSFDPPGYRPDRTYPGLAGHPYPDHSRPFGTFGVFRIGRWPGEQMWDEDFNNQQAWLGYYVGMFSHWWREPHVPYYPGLVKRHIQDPQQKGEWAGQPYEDDVMIVTPFITIPLQPWAGVRCSVAADRLLTAYDGTVWRGVASWDWYEDIIEIAFFMSEVRKGSALASYVVEKPFFIKQEGYGCRVRGYPYFATPPIDIYKNDVKVGYAYKTQFSSGATLAGDTEFQPGDILSLRSSDDLKKTQLGVSVTIIGGLL